MQTVANTPILQGCLRANDPLEADVLFCQLFEYETTQLEQAEFSREVKFCAASDFIVYQSRTGAPLHSMGTLVGNRLTMCLPQNPEPSNWWGRSIASDSIPYLINGAELEVLEEASFEHLTLTWDLNHLREIVSGSGPLQASKLPEFLASIERPPFFLSDHHGVAQEWRGFFRRQLDGAVAGEEMLSAERLSALGIGALLSLLETFDDSSAVKLPRPDAQNLINKAIAYDDMNRSLACSIPAICGHLQCSRRTLELAFREVLKTSPLQFLKRRRLNHMYKELLRCDPSDTSVTEVATGCGFRELGRCAGQFKKMFLSTPSEVLKSTRVSSGLLPILKEGDNLVEAVST